MTAQPSNGNSAVAAALFADLEALGVREYCVCAGARNAMLIEALTSRCAPLKHFFDERSAAFYALGRTMATFSPVAVLTTSGTAVAELLPAMVEAYYQGRTLVAVTADRPSRYSGSGAPQVIEQQGIFGVYAPRTGSYEWVKGQGLVRECNGAGSGPVHLNVCLEEGVSVIDAWDRPAPVRIFDDPLVGIQGELEAEKEDLSTFWSDDSPLMILASGILPGEAQEAAAFLARLGAPIVTEATANLHGFPELKRLMLSGGEKALLQSGARRVIRLGSVPSWRWWRDLEDAVDIKVLNITAAGFRGLARTENVWTLPWDSLAELDPVRLAQTSQIVSSALSTSLEQLVQDYPCAEPVWMRHVSRHIGDGASLFLGNSLPIREWNVTAGEVSKDIKVFANRGANGIDGLISTWLGIAAEVGESWLIVGDLSTLYDLGAPWVLSQMPLGKRRIVIINNGGGKIFSRVGWLGQLSIDSRRVMENPHQMSFEPWARLWGMAYQCVSHPEEWREASDAICKVIEVRPDAEQTEAFWKAWQGN